MSSKNTVYVQSLVDFTLDTKPYHSKLTDVGVRREFNETLNVQITDHLSSTIIDKAAFPYSYFSGGAGSNRVMSTHRTTVPLLRRTELNGLATGGRFKVGRDEVTDLLGVPGVFDRQATLGLADGWLERAGRKDFLVEGHDYFHVYGSSQIRISTPSQLETDQWRRWAEIDQANMVAELSNVTRSLALDAANPTSAISRIRALLLQIQANLAIFPNTVASAELVTLLNILDVPTLPQSYEGLLNALVAGSTPIIGSFTGWVGLDTPSARYVSSAFSALSPPAFFSVYNDLTLRESGRPVYPAARAASFVVTSIVPTLGAAIDEWTFTVLSLSPTILSVTGTVNGFVGLLTVGSTLTTTQATFTAIPGAGTPFIGDTATVAPDGPLVLADDALLEVWNIIRTNPLAYSRPVFSSSAYGYITSTTGVVGAATILDGAIPSGTVILTATSPTTFALSSSIEPAYTGSVTVGTPFNDGRLAFTVNSGSSVNFTVGDRFYINIVNPPAKAVDFDLLYGYDLDGYDNQVSVYSTDISSADYLRVLDFRFDSRFLDYDLSAFNLSLTDAAANGRSFRLRANADGAAFSITQKDGSGPNNYLDLGGPTSGIAPDPASNSAPVYSLTNDPGPVIPGAGSEPTANFSFTNTGGNTFQFADASTNTPTSWAWDFGEGTSTVQFPSFTFSTAGSRLVSLTATNAAGSDTRQLWVSNVVVAPGTTAIPQAAFLTPPTVHTGQPVQVLNQTPGIPFDPYFYSVSILCSFDGVAGSSTLTDRSIFQSSRTAGSLTTLSADTSKWGTTALKISYQDWQGGIWQGSRYGFQHGESYTIEFWWKHVSNTYNSVTAPPLVRVGNTFSGTSWQLSKYGTAGNLLGVLQPFQDNQFGYISAPDGWNHVACVSTLDAPTGNDILRVYVNGVLAFQNYISNGSVSGASYIQLGYNETADHQCLDYLSDFRVTKGIARYTANFTPPTGPFAALGPFLSEDPYFPFVVANVHFDGTPVDTSWRAQPLTSQSLVIDTVTPKFGTGAWSGVGQSVGNRERITYSPYSYANSFGEYDGCAELWVKSPENPTAGFLFSLSGNSLRVQFMQDPGTGLPTNKIRVIYHSNVIGEFDILTGYGNQWMHLAFVKQGENFTCYRNGQFVVLMVNGLGTIYEPDQIYLGADGFTGGSNPNGTQSVSGSLIDGEIDDFRLTIGVPRYTAPFTPPIKANPDGFPSTDITYTWSFGADAASGFEPPYSFTAQGTQVITLTATNVLGSTSVSHPVTVTTVTHSTISPDLILYYANSFKLQYSDDNFATINDVTDVAIGSSYSNPALGVSFFLAPGSKPFIGVQAKDGTDPRVEGGDVFTWTVVNRSPYQDPIPAQLVSTGSPRLVPHGPGFYEAVDANWTLTVTSVSATGFGWSLTGYYTGGPLIGQVVSGYPVTGSTVAAIAGGSSGQTYQDDYVYFTLAAGAGVHVGDAFSFKTYSRAPTMLVHGSVTGWQPEATVGEWYWNGSIGFKVKPSHALLFRNGSVLGNPDAGLITVNHVRRDAPACIYTFEKRATTFMVSRNGIILRDAPFIGTYKDGLISVTLNSPGASFTLQVVADERIFSSAVDATIFRPEIDALRPVAGDFVYTIKGVKGHIGVNLDYASVFFPPDLSLLAPQAIDTDYIDLSTGSIPIERYSPEAIQLTGWLPLRVAELDDNLLPVSFPQNATKLQLYSAADGQLVGSAYSGGGLNEPILFKWDETFATTYLPLNASGNVVIFDTFMDEQVKVSIFERLTVLIDGGALTSDALFRDTISVVTNEAYFWNINLNEVEAINAAIADGPFGGFLAGFDNLPYDAEDALGIDLTSLTNALGSYDTGQPLVDHFLRAQYLASLATPTSVDLMELGQLVNLIAAYLINGDLSQTSLPQFLAALSADTSALGGTVPTGGRPALGLGMDIQKTDSSAATTSIQEGFVLIQQQFSGALDTTGLDIVGIDAYPDTTAIMISPSAYVATGVPPSASSYAALLTPLETVIPARTFEIVFPVPVVGTPTFYLWAASAPAPIMVTSVEVLSTRRFRFSVAASTPAKVVAT